MCGGEGFGSGVEGFGLGVGWRGGEMGGGWEGNGMRGRGVGVCFAKGFCLLRGKIAVDENGVSGS